MVLSLDYKEPGGAAASKHNSRNCEVVEESVLLVGIREKPVPGFVKREGDP